MKNTFYCVNAEFYEHGKEDAAKRSGNIDKSIMDHIAKVNELFNRYFWAKSNRQGSETEIIESLAAFLRSMLEVYQVFYSNTQSDKERELLKQFNEEAVGIFKWKPKGN